LPLHGQLSSYSDTINIKEVVISRKRLNSYTAGFKKVTIDSSVLLNHNHGTLADLLEDNSTIFIKSYGLGGTALPSFRGTGSNHTQIAWNDININHPMLGQSDLSLIPVGFIDDIDIYYGGASMGLNSGGIGGIINLKTKPVWKKETLISVNPGIGSYGKYSGLVKVKSGNNHFQSVTKAFLQSSENDFSYLNSDVSSEPVWEKRLNSQVRQRGFIQELYFRKTKKILSARLWYQSAYRNLPSSMLSQQINSGEKQFDESLRTMLNYNLDRGRFDYFLTGSWMLNRLNYTNQLASIDSRNLSEALVIKTGLGSRLGESITLKVILNEEVNVIKSNNYKQNETRNNASITASAERNGNNRVSAMILIREIFDNNVLLIPDFSAGFQFRLIDAKEYFLKANISRNSKIPTMNDLFWLPGGNSELLNEYAFIYELSYDMKQKISPGFDVHYNLSVFRNTIKDMIQWHPGEYSYWTSDNIQNVNSTGLESSLSVDYRLNKISSEFIAGYSYTKATTVSSYNNNDIHIGKQLMYVPENQVNASLRMNNHNLYFSWVSNLVGRRYITVDNSGYLPHYFLNNITSGFKFNLRGNSLDINFTVNNLFGVNYQTIAYYPLPGRSYSIKILYIISK